MEIWQLSVRREIIHAANRGENLTTVFINNAIYGMTGGQMAPTTLPGMVTTSTPLGRDCASAGYPVKMSELLANTAGAVYIVRTAALDVASIRKTKQAIKQAFLNQIHELGFSCVEVLATCPTNWNMDPWAAMQWAKEYMIPYFPLGTYKITEQVEILAKVRRWHMRHESIILSGFGGQGVLFTGQLLAYSGMAENLYVTWIPSYGPEMRGGTANCTVIISEEEIGAPVVRNPTVAMVFNTPSFEKYAPLVKSGGF